MVIQEKMQVKELLIVTEPGKTGHVEKL